MGIEPISSAWKAENLPLIHIRGDKLLINNIKLLWISSYKISFLHEKEFSCQNNIFIVRYERESFVQREF
jgi:hypothetical protein